MHMTSLCILPGLDGTTRMLQGFMAAVHPSFAAVQAVAYPTDVVLGYRELETIARDELPQHSPFVLLGESFSGPIAISIAADPPPNLIGLVLSTTFARAPVPLLAPFSGLTRFAPVRMVPTAALSAVLLGRWSTPALRHELGSALSEVAPDVLRARAAAAMRIDVSDRLARITVPTLLLMAKHDRLLGAGAGRQLIDCIAKIRPFALDGPHLLLQTRTDRCAARIARFAAELRHRPPPGGARLG